MKWWIFNAGWGAVIIALAVLVAGDLREIDKETREILISVLGVLVAFIVGTAAAFVAYLQRSTAEKQVTISEAQSATASEEAATARAQLKISQSQLMLAKQQTDAAMVQLEISRNELRLGLFEKRYEHAKRFTGLTAAFHAAKLVKDTDLDEKLTDLLREIAFTFTDEIYWKFSVMLVEVQRLPQAEIKMVFSFAPWAIGIANDQVRELRASISEKMNEIHRMMRDATRLP